MRIIQLLPALSVLLWGCEPGEKDESAEGATSEVIDQTDGDDDSSGSGDDGGSGGDDGGSGGDDGGSGSDDGGDDGGDTGGDDSGDDGGDSGGDDGSSAMDIAPEALVGVTWQLELASANISEPPAVGTILTSVFTDSLFYGVTDADTDSLAMAVAVGSPDGAGFRLGDTLALGEADFADAPDFEVDGSGTILDYPYDGVYIPFEDPIFVGTMATDGEQLDTIELSAKIDTRDLGPLFGLGSSETAVCELVAGLGVSCSSCSDGEPLCLDLVAEWTNAPRIEGISLE